MAKGTNRGNRPSGQPGKLTQVPAKVNYDDNTPRFCLRHVVKDFDVEALPMEKRAAFALTLQHRAQLTWREIKSQPRHAAGTEFIPLGKIRASIPEQFQDQDQFMVFRYSGRLPMAGTRINDTFHILWIEKEFGELYDHGS